MKKEVKPTPQLGEKGSRPKPPPKPIPEPKAKPKAKPQAKRKLNPNVVTSKGTGRRPAEETTYHSKTARAHFGDASEDAMRSLLVDGNF